MSITFEFIMASGVKLSEIEELCRLIEEYRDSEENLKSENEILIQENIHLTNRQEKMADFIEVLEKTVMDLDEELTRNELLLEERENDIEILDNEIKIYQKEESNLVFKDKLQRDNYEDNVAVLQNRLIRVESSHKEKDEIINEYEISMNRQDEYIHSLISQLDRSNEAYDLLMEEIARSQHKNENKNNSHSSHNQQIKNSNNNSNDSNSHDGFQALFKIIDMQKYNRAKDRIINHKNQETIIDKPISNNPNPNLTTAATTTTTTTTNYNNATTASMVNIDLNLEGEKEEHNSYSYSNLNTTSSSFQREGGCIAEEKISRSSRSSSSSPGFKHYSSGHNRSCNNSRRNNNKNDNDIVYSDIDTDVNTKLDDNSNRILYSPRDRERENYYREYDNDDHHHSSSNGSSSNRYREYNNDDHHHSSSNGSSSNRRDRPTGPTEKPPINMKAPITLVRSLMNNRDSDIDSDRGRQRDDGPIQMTGRLGGRYGANSRERKNEITQQRYHTSCSNSNDSRYHHSPSPIDETMLRAQEREKEMAWVRQIRLTNKHSDAQSPTNDSIDIDHNNRNSNDNHIISEMNRTNDRDDRSSRLRAVRLDTLSPASLNSDDTSKEYEMRSLARDRIGDTDGYRSININVNMRREREQEKDKENISSSATVTSDTSLSIEIPRSKINNVAKANKNTNSNHTTYRRTMNNSVSSPTLTPTSPLSETSRSPLPGMPDANPISRSSAFTSSTTTKEERECRSPIANIDGLNRQAYRERRKGVLQSITSAANSFRRFSSNGMAMTSRFGASKINTIHPAEDSDISVDSRTERYNKSYNENHKHLFNSKSNNNNIDDNNDHKNGNWEETKSYV